MKNFFQKYARILREMHMETAFLLFLFLCTAADGSLPVFCLFTASALSVVWAFLWMRNRARLARISNKLKALVSDRLEAAGGGTNSNITVAAQCIFDVPQDEGDGETETTAPGGLDSMNTCFCVNRPKAAAGPEADKKIEMAIREFLDSKASSETMYMVYLDSLLQKKIEAFLLMLSAAPACSLGARLLRAAGLL